MGRHKNYRTRIRDADTSEIAALSYWFSLAGVDHETGAGELFTEHQRSGALGSAMDVSEDERYAELGRYLSQGKYLEASSSRTAVRAITVAGVTAGMAVAGPSPALLSRLSGSTADLVAGMLGLSKLHLLAVAPEHRGHGIGSQLLADITERATANDVAQMYGSFDSATNPALAQFYQQHGFDVMSTGTPLDLRAIFGHRVSATPGVGEAFFHRRF